MKTVIMNNIIKIHSKDNVVIATQAIQRGTSLSINENTILVKSDIPLGHKIAIAPIKQGDIVTKYSYTIGKPQKLLRQETTCIRTI